MRSLRVFLCSPLRAAAILWIAFAACLDAPLESGPAVARLVVAWDPLACGAPHRIAVELADEAGVSVAASTPCNLGGVTVDVAHLGTYHGRIYAWAFDAPMRSVAPIDVVIDQPIVRLPVATPP
jgi:hypothetical protein